MLSFLLLYKFHFCCNIGCVGKVFENILNFDGIFYIGNGGDIFLVMLTEN